MIFDWKLKYGFVFGIEVGQTVYTEDGMDYWIVDSTAVHIGPLEFIWMFPRGE